MLRSCYRTKMKFTTDPAEVPTPVRWYFVDDTPNVRWLPYYTQFGSANWATHKMLGDYDPPGEVSPYMGDRPWYNGARPFPPGGSLLPCGDEASWENGVTYPWTPLLRNAAGTPLCCLAKPPSRLSASVSLSSTVFQNPACWPCPHPLPQKLSASPSGWNPAWTTPAVNLNQPFILKRVTTTTPCFWTARVFKNVVENLTGTFQPVDVLVSAFTQLIAGHWIWGWDVQLVQHNPPFALKVEWGGSGPLSADCCTLTPVPFRGTIPGGIPPMGPISLTCAGGPDYSIAGSLGKKAGISSPAFYHPSGPVLVSLGKTVGMSSAVSYAPAFAFSGVLNKTVGVSSLVTYP